MKYAAEIEKGIPMPTPKRQRAKYPWEIMEVGDSFQIPLTDSHRHIQSLQAAIMSSSRQWKELYQKPQHGFRSAQVVGGKAVRVWRIK